MDRGQILINRPSKESQERDKIKLTTFKVLSNTDIKTIHQASLDILASCGVKVLCPETLMFLQYKGLDVIEDASIVKFTKVSSKTVSMITNFSSRDFVQN